MPSEPTTISGSARRALLTDLPSTNIVSQAQLFLVHKEAADRAPRTLHALEDSLVKFLRTPGMPETAEELSSDHIVLFLAELKRRGLSAGSRNHHQRALYGWLRWMWQRRVITWDIRREVEMITIPDAKRPSVTPDILFRLLTAAIAPPAHKGHRPNRERNVLIVRFLYDTGMRLGELLGIQWEDIDIDNQVVRIRAENTKDRSWRLAAFSTATKVAMREYNIVRLGNQRTQPAGSYLRNDDGKPITRNALRHTIDSLAGAAGVDVSAHAFRRGAIARMRQQGMDVAKVMTIVGHSSPTMVMHYSQDTEKEVAVEAWKALLG